MALAVVQSAAANGTTGTSPPEALSVTFGAAPQNGNLFIGVIGAHTGQSQVYSQGSPLLYYIDSAENGGSASGAAWERTFGASESTSQVVGFANNSTAYDYQAIGLEVSGQSPLSPINVHAIQPIAAATTHASPTITPSVNNCLIVAWFECPDTSATPTQTVTAGWTIQQITHSALKGCLLVATIQQSTAAAISCTATSTEAGGTQALGVTGIMAIAPNVAVPGVSIADSATFSVVPTPLPACSWPNGPPPQGNVLLAIANGNGSKGAIVAPSGWTALFNPGSSSTDNYISSALFWKLAGASEPATLTWGAATTGGNLCINLLSIAGAVTTTPQWVQATSTTSPITTGSLTPAAIGALVIAGFNGGTVVSGCSVASGWVALSGSTNNAYYQMFEQRVALTTDTTTAISVASTYSGGTISALNAYLLIIAAAVAAAIPSQPYQPWYQRAPILAQ